MSAPIRTLFVDVGGVLLTNGWDRAARQRAVARFGLDAADYDERHHLAFDVYEMGRITLVEYLDRTVFHVPRSFGRDEFVAFMLEQSQPFPEMIELVQRVKTQHGLKVVVLSNEGRELTLHRIQRFELASFVDFFVSSCFVGMRKPDPGIYRLAIDVAQSPPENIAYVDDRLPFVEMGRTFGLQSIQHTDAAATCKALALLGLSI